MKTKVHFLITSRSVLLKMSIVSDKCFRENRNTHFVFSNGFEIVWENVVESDRPRIAM